MMIKPQNLFLLILLFTASTVIAQKSPYTRQGSIGSSETEKSDKVFSIGDRVIFPPDKSSPEYFPSIKIDGAAPTEQQVTRTSEGRYVFENFDGVSSISSNLENLKYKQYVGRVGKIIGLSENKGSGRDLLRSLYTPLQIQMEDNNEKIKLLVGKEYALIPVAPIDKARALFKGKTF